MYNVGYMPPMGTMPIQGHPQVPAPAAESASSDGAESDGRGGKTRILKKRTTDEDVFSRSYKTVGPTSATGALGRDRKNKILYACNAKVFSPIVLCKMSKRQIDLLLAAACGLLPKTKLCDILLGGRTKGELRDLAVDFYNNNGRKYDEGIPSWEKVEHDARADGWDSDDELESEHGTPTGGSKKREMSRRSCWSKTHN